MLRQQRRRLERQWNKIKVGSVCTDFLERNNLFKPPHIIEYHAVKVSDELVLVLNIGLFDFHKRDKGHGEYVTTCMFAGGCLKNLDSIRLGFVHELDLWAVDEID